MEWMSFLVEIYRNGPLGRQISYRLGIDYANIFDLENELIASRVHDGRAAVRYFRQSVEEENNPGSDRISWAASPPERSLPFTTPT